MAIVLTILGFIFLIISMRVKFLNRLCTLLFNIARLVLLIILINSPAKLYTDEIDMSIILLIIAGVTTFLTLYGLGSTAFDDTREETGDFIINPIEGGGYKIAKEITGTSPIGTFIVAILFAAGIGVAMYFLILWLQDKQLDVLSGANSAFLLVVSILGILRALISFFKGLKD